MTAPQTIATLRSQALTQAWRDDPCPDICIDGFRLLRRHNQLPHSALTLMQDMADQIVPAARSALYAGAPVNCSEQQAALHMALRAAEPARYLPDTTADEVLAARQRMLHIADCLHHGRSTDDRKITDVVHIGIGGSELGPRLLINALAAQQPGGEHVPAVHFMSGPDLHWPMLRARLDPATTQVIVVSKSLGTSETLFNWQQLRDWQQCPELVVTAAPQRAQALGIQAQHILPLWPWVGGRYSFASAVSLSAAAVIGSAQFLSLLQAAEAMDRHFLMQPMAENLPVQLALLDFWNHCIRRFPARGVFTYHPGLQLFSNWLQQLEMESNGKCVDPTGQRLQLPSAALVFGGDGPGSQHAMFQLLHQGERDWPLELVGVLPHSGDTGMQLLLAQLLGQWETLAGGDQQADPVRALPGQRPVTALLLPALDAATVGALLACHEHKTFTLASLIGCNPFDQWGVEAGKQATARIAAALSASGTDSAAVSDSMQAVLNWLHDCD
ncbi:MAG: glucose-6-phosphate isomerase [Wenzhouxiangellaceae bacterium]